MGIRCIIKQTRRIKWWWTRWKEYTQQQAQPRQQWPRRGWWIHPTRQTRWWIATIWREHLIMGMEWTIQWTIQQQIWCPQLPPPRICTIIWKTSVRSLLRCGPLIPPISVMWMVPTIVIPSIQPILQPITTGMLVFLRMRIRWTLWPPKLLNAAIFRYLLFLYWWSNSIFNWCTNDVRMKRSIIRMCMWIEHKLIFRTNDSTLIEYKALLTTLFDNIQKNGCIQVEVFLLKTTTIHRQFPFFFPRIFNKLIRFWIFYIISKYYPFVKIWKIQMTRAFIYSIVYERWKQLISLGPEVPFTSLDMNNLAKNILNLEKENKKIEERIQYLEQALNEYVIILRNNPLVLNAILWLSTIRLSTSIHPRRFQNPYMERLISSSSILMNESLVTFFIVRTFMYIRIWRQLASWC